MSAQTPTSSATTSTQAPQAISRPAYLPETFWDPATNSIKPEFGDHYSQMATRLAADEVRRNALPQKPDDFKVATTPAFKPPEGLEFKFNEADPLWSQARTLAQAEGLSQDAFSKFVDLFAGHHIATEQAVQTARNGEIAKLGTAGTARMTAIETFYTGLFGSADEAKAEMSRIWTAADVARHEKKIAKFSNQGTASFRQDGRVPHEAGGRVDDATYNAMSQGERWNYSRSFDQKQFQAKAS